MEKELKARIALLNPKFDSWIWGSDIKTGILFPLLQWVFRVSSDVLMWLQFEVPHVFGKKKQQNVISIWSSCRHSRSYKEMSLIWRLLHGKCALTIFVRLRSIGTQASERSERLGILIRFCQWINIVQSIFHDFISVISLALRATPVMRNGKAETSRLSSATRSEVRVCGKLTKYSIQRGIKQ